MADRYLVRVRFFGEERDIREFIQPWSSPVADVAGRLPAGKDEAVPAAWEYVQQHVAYPLVEPFDYRYQEAFVRHAGGIKVFEPRVALLSETRYDYWQMPAETLAERTGDCEDSSMLLCSILRARLSPEEVFVTIGMWQGYGHAWATVVRNGRDSVLETTRAAQEPLKPEGPPYVPYVRFNDAAFREVRRGLLEGVRPRYRVEVGRLKSNQRVKEKIVLLHSC
jgi:transglutaminase-like putative cysteine protease